MLVEYSVASWKVCRDVLASESSMIASLNAPIKDQQVIKLKVQVSQNKRIAQ
jgi:hypothetical protein